MKSIIIYLWVLSYAISSFAEAYSAKKIINLSVPTTVDATSLHIDFVKELLAIIIENQQYQLNFIYQQSDVSQSRTVKLLNVGVIDLDWAAVTEEREHSLTTVRIPIYQHMIGWRVLFIRKNNLDTFKDIDTIEQLRKLTAVQRFDWADYHTLKKNDLKVEGNMSFEGQSKAVEGGLVDYYPRSIIEAVKELNAPFNRGLMIEPNILLKYQSGYYFYVKKGNHSLAELLTKGFQNVIDSGQYQQLFDRYFAEDLQQLNLEQRRVISLIN